MMTANRCIFSITTSLPWVSLMVRQSRRFPTHIPAIADRHPSAHTIVHGGVNNLSCRQSIKLQEDYELLATTIESLGKICIFSGLIPNSRWSSEMFRCLYRVDQWLSNFCSACSYGFIDHFDLFWKKFDLYKNDNLHLNEELKCWLQTSLIIFLVLLTDAVLLVM